MSDIYDANRTSLVDIYGRPWASQSSHAGKIGANFFTGSFAGIAPFMESIV
jgi:hypothetical protein